MAQVITPISALPAAVNAPVAMYGQRASPPAASEANSAVSTPAEPSSESVEEAINDIARHFETLRTDLQFRMDQSAGRMVVSVVDARDGTVLRQLPSEVALRIARHLDQYQAHLVEEVV